MYADGMPEETACSIVHTGEGDRTMATVSAQEYRAGMERIFAHSRAAAETLKAESPALRQWRAGMAAINAHYDETRKRTSTIVPCYSRDNCHRGHQWAVPILVGKSPV